MDIEINRHLFAAYCGLISSGYDLTDTSDESIRGIVESIKAVHLPDSLLRYFSRARTNRVAVNPYYPYASDLSVACFFLQKPLSDLLSFLNSCAAKEYRDQSFAAWISELPKQLDEIENRAEFSGLFSRYVSAVNTRCAGAQAGIDDVWSIVAGMGFADGTTISFAPNPLQSPFLTDYALVDGKLYVISTAFSETGTLHECLHLVFGGYRSAFAEAIGANGIERFVDVPRMYQIGYMPDDSLDSRCHAVEDCFIRGMTGALVKSISLPQYCRMNIEQGFCGVPQIIRFVRENLPQRDLFPNYILQALAFSDQ